MRLRAQSLSGIHYHVGGSTREQTPKVPTRKTAIPQAHPCPSTPNFRANFVQAIPQSLSVAIKGCRLELLTLEQLCPKPGDPTLVLQEHLRRGTGSKGKVRHEGVRSSKRLRFYA